MKSTAEKQTFEGLRDRWESVLPHCVTNNIFLTPSWQQAWWQVFGKDSQLTLLPVETRSGEGIAPLILKDGVISFLGGTDLFDYHDFLVPKGAEGEFYPALMERLARLSWRVMDLRSLQNESPTIGILESLARERGYKVEIEREDVSPGTVLPRSWEDFMAGLSVKDRHELRRKIRRLEAEGQARQYVLTAPEEISAAIDDFFVLLRKSRQDKAEFLIPARETFFRQATYALAQKGQTRLYFMDFKGVRVASALCFDYSGTFYLYNSGYDPEYSPMSVGLINKAWCIKDAIEKGRAYFDFLRGSEAYKYHLGGKDRIVSHMVIRRGV